MAYIISLKEKIFVDTVQGVTKILSALEGASGAEYNWKHRYEDPVDENNLRYFLSSIDVTVESVTPSCVGQRPKPGEEVAAETKEEAA